MNVRLRCSKEFLITAIVVVGVGLFVIFPANHGMSASRVRQRDSDQQLRHLAGIIAMCDSENVTSSHSAITELEYNIDRWAGSFRIVDCDVFDKLTNVRTNIMGEMHSSFAGKTVSEHSIVFTYTSKGQSFLVVNGSTHKATNMVNIATFESRIVAHERLGLWPDDTVAVYLKQLGVVRMKTADFKSVACGAETVLRFNSKVQCWEHFSSTISRSGLKTE